MILSDAFKRKQTRTFLVCLVVSVNPIDQTVHFFYQHFLNPVKGNWCKLSEKIVSNCKNVIHRNDLRLKYAKEKEKENHIAQKRSF